MKRSEFAIAGVSTVQKLIMRKQIYVKLTYLLRYILKIHESYSNINNISPDNSKESKNITEYY